MQPRDAREVCGCNPDHATEVCGCNPDAGERSARLTARRSFQEARAVCWQAIWISRWWDSSSTGTFRWLSMPCRQNPKRSRQPDASRRGDWPCVQTGAATNPQQPDASLRTCKHAGRLASCLASGVQTPGMVQQTREVLTSTYFCRMTKVSCLMAALGTPCPKYPQICPKISQNAPKIWANS